jgi:formate/nitrite transporter FocA (FNT family)
MTGLMFGLLLPHGEGITWAGYAYNLALATAGNIIGGAVFVAGLYWLGSPKARINPRADAISGNGKVDGTLELEPIVRN